MQFDLGDGFYTKSLRRSNATVSLRRRASSQCVAAFDADKASQVDWFFKGGQSGGPARFIHCPADNCCCRFHDKCPLPFVGVQILDCVGNLVVAFLFQGFYGIKEDSDCFLVCTVGLATGVTRYLLSVFRE